MADYYPTTFPSPRLAPYAWTADMGVLRTGMDGGYARQRRLYDVMPQAFRLTFVIPVSLLDSWQNWVNQYAFDYFWLPLVSWRSSRDGACATPHLARFTSNLQFDLTDKGVVTIQVDAELSPIQEGYNPPTGLSWIIAGSPAQPSADEIVAGTPAGPATDFIRAGSPPAPSL